MELLWKLILLRVHFGKLFVNILWFEWMMWKIYVFLYFLLQLQKLKEEIICNKFKSKATAIETWYI